MTKKCELKAAAAARGEPLYVSRTPCKKCSSLVRRTSGGGCDECGKKYHIAWIARNPEVNRENGRKFRERRPVETRAISVRTALKTRYGLTEQTYEAMFTAQRGCCAVCGTEIVSRLDTGRPFRKHASTNDIAHVDHDHATNKVRGLLCFDCNVLLGKAKDDEQILLSAVRYLRESATAQRDSHLHDVKVQGEKGPVRRDPDRATSRVSRREELSPFLN